VQECAHIYISGIIHNEINHMATYMICRITDKNKLEVVEIVSREQYESLEDNLRKAIEADKLNADTKEWGKANEDITLTWPRMTIPSLLNKYKDTIILNYHKLL